VDLSPFLFDASFVKRPLASSCTDYWDCTKDSGSWKSVLIGGMGQGGATRIMGDSCTDCVKTPILDPYDNTKGWGYSSYFALDVTDPPNPALLWEFYNPQLGFATTGPAIVRVGDPATNGRWFAVFASGPTGPIDTVNHQFLARSDQNLRLFVVDVANGTLVRTIDTGIANAFGASMLSATLDTDKYGTRTGAYTDDVLYVGYVREGRTALNVPTGVWDKGGILRVVTRDILNTSAADYSPSNPGWVVNKVIDGIGPVTSGLGKLIDRQNGKIWLYFGTGRFYYRTPSSVDMDGASDQLALYGITDPCFISGDIDDACATNNANPTELNPSSDLDDQTSSPGTSIGSQKGWYVNLRQKDATGNVGYYAERVITDPVAAPNGIVYFTSFAPSKNMCQFNGNTFLWAVNYDTGGTIPYSLRSGKIVLQVSTGAFQEVDMTSEFSDRDNRSTGGLAGIPSGAGTAPLVITNAGMTPVRKILHIREK
jgi:type IV pilus assembly protein PilY1